MDTNLRFILKAWNRPGFSRLFSCWTYFGVKETNPLWAKRNKCTWWLFQRYWSPICQSLWGKNEIKLVTLTGTIASGRFRTLIFFPLYANPLILTQSLISRYMQQVRAICTEITEHGHSSLGLHQFHGLLEINPELHSSPKDFFFSIYRYFF